MDLIKKFIHIKQYYIQYEENEPNQVMYNHFCKLVLNL